MIGADVIVATLSVLAGWYLGVRSEPEVGEDGKVQPRSSN